MQQTFVCMLHTQHKIEITSDFPYLVELGLWHFLKTFFGRTKTHIGWAKMILVGGVGGGGGGAGHLPEL
jgi:hypothetical protein